MGGDVERKIQVVHLPGGSDIDASALNSRIEKIYDKFTKISAKELYMEVYFKEFHKSGGREQVQVKVNLSGPGLSLHAMEEEWDSAKALKKAFAAIEKEYERLKSRKKGK